VFALASLAEGLSDTILAYGDLYRRLLTQAAARGALRRA
jgi:hypothetical protein